jgi:diphthamide synthase (EF-2-diphthine--ammonia ligase)
MGHAEVAADVFLGCLTFLVANDHNRAIVEIADSSHHCWIVGVEAITMEFNKVVEQVLKIVQRMWPLWMSR